MKAAINAADWPPTGSVSFATPMRPVPASAVAEAFVIGLMSSGSSLPLYLPPSSIARCAAAAYVRLFDGLAFAKTFVPSMS